jgi:hypothetical protein
MQNLRRVANDKRVIGLIAQPKWQLRLIATLLLVLAAFRNDLIFAFMSGLMLGWSFSYEGKK